MNALKDDDGRKVGCCCLFREPLVAEKRLGKVIEVRFQQLRLEEN